MNYRIVNYLRGQGVDYGVLTHAQAYTALEVAQTAHIKGRQLLKSVVVKVNDQLSIVVMPAHYQLQLSNLCDQLAADCVVMVSEQEFSAHLDGCEPGAVPAFGSLFGMATYTAVDMEPNETVALSAGSHTELLLMPWGEYLSIEKPEYIEGIIAAPSMTPPKMAYRRGRLRM